MDSSLPNPSLHALMADQACPAWCTVKHTWDGGPEFHATGPSPLANLFQADPSNEPVVMIIGRPDGMELAEARALIDHLQQLIDRATAALP